MLHTTVQWCTCIQLGCLGRFKEVVSQNTYAWHLRLPLTNPTEPRATGKEGTKVGALEETLISVSIDVKILLSESPT
jgi:hypothetical protein